MAFILHILILFALADLYPSAIFNGNGTLDPINPINIKQDRNSLKTRRRERSTSSSSNERRGKDNADAVSSGQSLELSSSDSSDNVRKAKKKGKHYKPKSSKERSGWRKWHRKCQQCPYDMNKKWRDPSISWICGAYQSARRSFKSLCSMHYRNCQDGTMFTKIAEHRCPNSTDILNHGEHFFYDYKVQLSMDSSDDKKSLSNSASESSESSSESKSLNTEQLESLERIHVDALGKRENKTY